MAPKTIVNLANAMAPKTIVNLANAMAPKTIVNFLSVVYMVDSPASVKNLLVR